MDNRTRPLGTLLAAHTLWTRRANACAFDRKKHCPNPGISVEILQMAAAMIGWKLEIVMSNTNGLGLVTDDPYSGMSLLRNGTVHVLGPDFDFTDDRIKVVTPSYPLEISIAGVVIRALGTQADDSFDFFAHIKPEFAGTCVFVVAVMYATRKAALMGLQRSHLDVPAGFFEKPLRIPLLVLSFLVLLAVNLYASALSINLAMPPEKTVLFKSIDELKNLLNAGKMTLIILGTDMGLESYVRSYFNSLNRTFLRRVRTIDAGIQMVKTQSNVAMMVYKADVVHYLKQHSNTLGFIDDQNFPVILQGFLFGPSTPKALIERLTYTNLAILQKHFDYLQTRAKYTDQHDDSAVELAPDLDNVKPWSPLLFIRSESLFEPLLMGFGAGVACILVEILWSTMRRLRERENRVPR